MPQNKGAFKLPKWEFSKNVKKIDDVKFDYLLTAYGLDNSSSCQQNRSHPNRPCNSNTRCVNNLDKKVWTHEKPPKSSTGDMYRVPGEFVGLINHGQLCYANVFLQLWYHTKGFRYDIYKHAIEEEEASNPTFGTDNYVPISKIGLLQMLFADLEFSMFNTVDPMNFIVALSLRADMQQDAHEFSTLFTGNPPSLKCIFGKYYNGTMAYTTKCLRCNSESGNTSEFSTLAINVSEGETVDTGLARSLADESLDGDNMYQCQTCGMKTNATKSSVLKTLPPVLLLQVVRSFYNKDAKKRDKLRATVRIPHELDLSQYVNKDEVKHHEYKLRGIICHIGTKCHQGHYIANIKNEENDKWHVFNDTEVTSNVPVSKIKIGEGIRKIKAEPGQILSNTCYMLVYESKEKEAVDTTLPVWLEDYVTRRHQEQKKEYDELKEQEAERHQQWMVSKQYMGEKLKIMFAESVRDADLMSFQWLMKWAKDPTNPGPISHSEFLCQHDKLHYMLKSHVKCVNPAVADELYEKYGGGPRLKVSECMCLQCIYTISMSVSKWAEASVVSSNINKSQPAKGKKSVNFIQDEGFWVGKISYQRWGLLYKNILEAECLQMQGPVNLVETSSENETGRKDVESETDENDEPKPNTNLKNGSEPGQVKRSASDMEDHEEDEPHHKSPSHEHCNGGDTPDTSQKCPEEDDENPMDGVEEQQAVQAEQPEETKGDIITNGTNGGEPSTSSAHASNVPAVAINGAVTVNFFNEDVLCVHGNLTADENKRKLVPDGVWAYLVSYFENAPTYTYDAEPCPQCQEQIEEKCGMTQENKKAASELKNKLSQLNRPKPVYKYSGNRPHLLYLLSKHSASAIRTFMRSPNRVEPPLSIDNECLLCDHKKVHVDLGLNGEYRNLPSDFDDMYELLPPEEWDVLKERFAVDHEIKLITDASGDFTDPEMCDECLTGRRDLLQYSYQDELMSVLRAAEPTREPTPPFTATGRPNRGAGRSASHPEARANSREDARPHLRRRNKQRGDFDIPVSASDTLHQVLSKVQTALNLMNELCMISDLHLSVAGRELEGNDLTMRDLNVLQGDVFTLRMDSSITPPDEVASTPSSPGAQDPEVGFTGTRL